ncbi:hypothetical protein BGZ65_010911 [Modicella reniformis]|uniref:Uncharacterized protein n=1 Tax=Modicella reniformis TaxID=1440133 RepID=A0A9P6SP38_9FUNG|nr:hypothetical protein BGZ65_010911 [Modicella reniformis]
MTLPANVYQEPREPGCPSDCDGDDGDDDDDDDDEGTSRGAWSCACERGLDSILPKVFPQEQNVKVYGNYQAITPPSYLFKPRNQAKRFVSKTLQGSSFIKCPIDELEE